MVNNMNSPASAFIGGINNTVKANQANPQPLIQDVEKNSNRPVVHQDLVKLIAKELLTKQLADKENAINLALNVPKDTVADRIEDELTQNVERQIAQHIGGVNKKLEGDKQQNLQRIAGANQVLNTGLGTVRPNPTSNMSNRDTGIANMQPMTAAHGGLVSFQGGEDQLVEAEDPETYGDVLVEVGEETLNDMWDVASDYPVLLTALGSVGILKAGKLGYKVTQKAYDLYKKTKAGEATRIPSTHPAASDLWAKLYKGKEHLKRNLDRYGIGVPGGIEGGVKLWNIPVGDDDGEGGEVAKPSEEILRLQAALRAAQQKLAATDETTDPVGAAAIKEQLTNLLAQFKEEQEIREGREGEYTTKKGELEKRATTGLEKYDEGLASLLDATKAREGQGFLSVADTMQAQMEEYEAYQDAIDRLTDMLPEVKGGQKAALRDLIVGLSQMAGAPNLGYGLGALGQTIAQRQEGREDKARTFEKEILAQEVALAGKKLQGVKDINELRDGLNKMYVDNQMLLNSARTERRALAERYEDAIFEMQKLLSAEKLGLSELERTRITAQAAAIVQMAQVHSFSVETDTNTTLAMIELVNSIVGIVSQLSYDDMETEDKEVKMANFYEQLMGISTELMERLNIDQKSDIEAISDLDSAGT